MRATLAGALLAATTVMAACSPGGLGTRGDGVFAPGVDPRGSPEDGLVVGHRLMAAGEAELALDAFLRAAGEEGLTPEVLMGLGSAKLALGRLNQAERHLRDAMAADPDNPAILNNLGVVVGARGKDAEAAGLFRQAFALDNAQNPEIRDNLALALAKRDDPGYASQTQEDYRLVRRGSGLYQIRRTP